MNDLVFKFLFWISFNGMLVFWLVFNAKNCSLLLVGLPEFVWKNQFLRASIIVPTCDFFLQICVVCVNFLCYFLAHLCDFYAHCYDFCTNLYDFMILRKHVIFLFQPMSWKAKRFAEKQLISWTRRQSKIVSNESEWMSTEFRCHPSLLSCRLGICIERIP